MSRRRKLPKKFLYRRIGLLVITFIVILGIVALIQWLRVLNKVEIVGTNRLKDQQILKVVNYKPGDRYPSFRKGALERQLESLNYVKKSKIRYQFPKSMKITIEEEIPVAQIKDKSGFLLLNKELKILEKTRAHSLNLIEISGLSTSDLTPGKSILDAKLNKSKLDFFSEFFNHDFQKDVKTIEFKEQGLHLTMKNEIKVIIVSFKDSGYKLSQLEIILDQIKGQEEDISTILLDQGEHPIAIRKGEDSLLLDDMPDISQDDHDNSNVNRNRNGNEENDSKLVEKNSAEDEE